MKTLYLLGLPPLILTSVVAICQQPPQSTPYTVLGNSTSYTALGNSTIKVTIPAPPDEHAAATVAPDTVVLSGTAKTARIADPNEPVVFSGRVMRMADFVAAVSSSSAAAQHPHIQEMRSHETDRPAPQSSPPDSR